ncbi:MAG: J domain-containing protein [Chloroflexia bacterium]|nr:J domain-containing protein [Chloroflexia bacterium]
MSETYNNPYTTLGLSVEASAAEIKRAYFALVREYPPERDPEQFKRIRAAYEQLRDPEKRLETDMQLLQPWQASSSRRRPPAPVLDVSQQDLLLALELLTDLHRTDWREDYEVIKLS